MESRMRWAPNWPSSTRSTQAWSIRLRNLAEGHGDAGDEQDGRWVYEKPPG